MWQVLCGFGAGVYVGTYFECKPTILKIISFAKSSIPEKKDGDDKDAKDKEKKGGSGSKWF
jgi:hypothetical protein